jgi:hypothetical protein
MIHPASTAKFDEAATTVIGLLMNLPELYRSDKRANPLKLIISGVYTANAYRPAIFNDCELRNIKLCWCYAK